MFFADDGIVISYKELGNKTIILQCFLCNHGLRSAISYSKIIPALGSFIAAEWYGRLPEQLGTYRVEQHNINPASSISFMRKESVILNTALNTIQFCLNDREKNIDLWHELYNFIITLSCDLDISIKLYHYLKLELKILKNSGIIAYNERINIGTMENIYDNKNNSENIDKFNKTLHFVMDMVEKGLLYNLPGIMPARNIIKNMLF